MFQNKTRLLIFATVFLIAGVAVFFISKNTFSAKQEDPKKRFFATAPIVKLASLGAPCLEMQIEDKTFIMELDLGFRGDLSLSGEFIDQISSKSFLGTKTMYGFKGHAYETNLYQIPKIQIGPLSVWQMIAQEECEKARNDAILVKKTGLLQREPGKLGWELFRNCNLLIDIQNNRVAFCDGLETLKQRGYPTETIVCIPLIKERGLIEFDTVTSNGPLRCVLDTGSTWNILNMEIKGSACSPSNTVAIKSFKISNKDFGPIEFHRIPIQIPIHVEAILGMEFFQDHLVFIDFSQGKICFLNE